MRAYIFHLRLGDGWLHQVRDAFILGTRIYNMSQEYIQLPHIASKYLLTFRRTPPDSSEVVSPAGKKRPVSCRHTLEDEVDDTSALLSVKSGEFHGGWKTKARSGYVNAVLRISVIIGNCFNHGYGKQVNWLKARQTTLG